MASLFEELKRRKVFRVAAVYAVAAWLIIQVIDVILPTFNAPQWVNQTIILVLVLGLPAALVLAWAFDASPVAPGSGDSRPGPPGAGGGGWLTNSVLGFMVLAVGFLLLERFLSDSADTAGAGGGRPAVAVAVQDASAVQRTVVSLDGGQRLATADQMPLGVGRPLLAISSQGSLLAYTVNRDNSTQIYIRRMDEFDARPVAGTEGGFFPFFSPDEQWLGFLTPSQIMKVPVAGGTPQALADAGNVYGAVWGPDDNIVYSEREGIRLSEVNADGGASRVLLDSVIAMQVSDVLPDGLGYLLNTWNGEIVVFNPGASSSRPLGIAGIKPTYLASGHVGFLRGENYMAAPFDLATLTLTGTPVPVLNDVLIEVQPQLDIADSGSLVYVAGPDTGITTPVWVDRSGTEEATGLPALRYGSFSLSPDDSQLAIEVSGTVTDVWLYDFQRATPLRRLTVGGNKLGNRWSKDGQDVLFGSIRALNSDVGAGVYQQQPNGSEARPIMPQTAVIVAPETWLNPERLVVTQTASVTTHEDIYIIDPSGESEPVSFAASEAVEWGASASPNGDYIAYTSDETGQYQIYVKPFPETGERWIISAGYGEEPVWSAVGDEIIYRRGNEWLSVPVRTEPEFSFDVPRLLFAGNYRNVPGLSYNQTADGQRFLLLKKPLQQATAEIRVVSNWLAELQRLLPTDRD